MDRGTAGAAMMRWFGRAQRRAEHRPQEAGWYAVQTSEHLLAPHAQSIHQIREAVGLPPAHWRTLYAAMFERYAGFVQQLPASEAHHHCGVGGLLTHGLEVVRNALKRRRGALLPPGATPEESARTQDLWSYAVCSACLLHDIGKPVVNQRILLRDPDGRAIGVWDPWRGPMPPGHAYQVTFERGQPYQLHEPLAALFARLIVPEIGLSWLGSDREVLRQWSATLSAHPEDAGAIGELVHEADRRSVAANLAGEQTRLPAARAKPLHERLTTALPYLVDQGDLPLNTNGAAGWITEDSAWFVVKRALDRVREHLQQEGHSGIPARNDRLMDELQQHGVLTPLGDKAVWRMRVFAPEWPKAHDLTMLRFPLGKLWPDPESRPPAFAGTISASEAPEGDVDAEASPLPENAVQADPAAILKDVPPDHEVPLPPVAAGNEMPQRSERGPQNESTEDPDEHAEEDATADAGRRFLAWVRDGLKTGRLETNSIRARIHRVEEGLLLVSPGIFKDYPDAHGADWDYVQKRFTKLRLHRKNPDGTNIHTYVVSGRKKTSAVKGYLIPEAELAAIFPAVTLPDRNPHLALML